MNVNYHSYFVTHLQPLFNVRTEHVIQHLRHLQLLKNACVCASCGGAMSQTRRKKRLDGHIWYVCMYVCDTHMWHMHRPPAAWVCSLDAHKWCYKRSQRHSTSFVNPTKWASWEHTHSAQACRSMCIDLYSLWQALGVCHWSSVQKFSIKQPPKTKCGTQTCPKVWPPCLYISEDVPSAAVGVSFVNTNSNRRLRIGLQIFCTAVHSNPPMPVVLIPAIPACSCRSTVPASPPVTMESFLVLSSSFWLSVLLGPLIW